ncbi:PPC domain-containing protein [Pontiella desulfatans]|nr:PPC domain-containing protein [Pontiella desulfatans]
MDPHIGYIYPAGAQRGATATIVVGGQYLEGADGIHVSGGGVRAKVLDFERPLNQREIQQMRNKFDEIREEMGMEEDERPTRQPEQFRTMIEQAEKSGITMEDVQKMREQGRIRNDPKLQENAQIAEVVTVEIEVLPDARPGRRELRIMKDGRISAPLAFFIGDHAEWVEADGKNIEKPLPVVLNGQILPGETDRYSFKASKGDQLVVAAAARELIPHLADAVPGWFQAVMALYDSKGSELAYADDYRFNPDPALYYEIPTDGTYTLEIRDSIYRGRQDFVYRITLGEIPFITSIFPLGGKEGTTTVAIQGKNLPATTGTVGNQDSLDSVKGIPLAYPVPFAHSTLPELPETEPNNTVTDAMPIRSTCVINGRIGHPGDLDVFEIQLKKGEAFVAEVNARRLNSPLDSVLKITDAHGRQVAFNDDHEDRALGLLTHHADSRIAFVAPHQGTFLIHLGDTQNAGGPDHGYRLHLGRPEPDYELRIVPSHLNGAPGASIPFTAFALRKDGFNGEIKLELKNEIDGLRLDGARIPAGQEQVELTLTLPTDPLYVPEPLKIEGRAVIDGKPAVRPAVPAEDMMQAFIYHHLVPAEEILLANIESRFLRPQINCKTKDPLKLKPGTTTSVTFEAPTAFGRQQLDFNVEPHSVPAGVGIEDVTIGNGTIEVMLATDPALSVKGQEGNLIFELVIERNMQAREGREARTLRIPAGHLPAVPFKIM